MLIVVTLVRCTPARYDPEYAWLKSERVEGRWQMVREYMSGRGREARSSNLSGVHTLPRLIAGSLLTLAGSLWTLAIMGHAPSIPLFCSLLLILAGGVFIIRVTIPGASERREAYIGRRDD